MRRGYYRDPRLGGGAFRDEIERRTYFEQGQRDKANGVKRNENPYGGLCTKPAIAWDQGWLRD